MVVATRSLARIVELNAAEGYAVVEPGVVLDDLNAAAAAHGLRVGPDPSTHSRCTIGGMIGNNACGSHSVIWGTTAQNILGLDVIRSDGSRVRLTSPDAPARPADPEWPELDGPLAYDLRAFTAEHEELIRRELPAWPRRVSGYALDWLLPERGPDHAKALVGTEGTCAVVARAVVRLVRPPAARALLVLGFEDDIDGADAVPALLTAEPVHRRVAVGRAAGSGACAGRRRRAARRRRLAHGRGTRRRCRGRARARAAAGASGRPHAGRPRCPLHRGPGRVRQHCGASARTEPATPSRFADGTKGWPGFEDSAVPPERLGSLPQRAARRCSTEHGMQAITYGHYGEGCIHLRVGFGLDASDGPERYERFMSDAADLVVRHGGSLSGEHGDGRSRGPLLERQFSPELIEAFAAFRRTWDPSERAQPRRSSWTRRPSPTDLRATAPTLLRASPRAGLQR